MTRCKLSHPTRNFMTRSCDPSALKMETTEMVTPIQIQVVWKEPGKPTENWQMKSPIAEWHSVKVLDKPLVSATDGLASLEMTPVSCRDDVAITVLWWRASRVFWRWSSPLDWISCLTIRTLSSAGRAKRLQIEKLVGPANWSEFVH